MLRKISDYRSPLMAFAIFCVMLYHTEVNFSFEPVHTLISSVYMGVDIFFFLSGFGLYRSLTRNPDVIPFYVRRARKIYPAFLPILLIWLIIQCVKLPISEIPECILGNITGLSFWFQKNPYFNWYILSLPALYLTAPLMVKAVNSGNRKIIALLFLLSYVCVCCGFGVARYQMFFWRIPVFIVGLFFGKAHMAQREPCPRTQGLLLILFAVFYAFLTLVIFRLNEDTMWKYGLWFSCSPMILPGGILILCTLFSLLDRIPVGRQLMMLLSWIGSASLEIYAIHLVLFDFVPDGTGRKTWAVLCLLMAFLGILYHRLISFIQGKLSV